MRPCPICLSEERRALHFLTLTLGDAQAIFVCEKCGMVYASVGEPVDYDEESIYALPTALGSGVSPTDRDRVMDTARLIERLEIPKDAAILDVGCAQGALLAALRELGYVHLCGLDPSLACVNMTRSKGITAFAGTISMYANEGVGRYDLIILSHVLEHIADLHEAMRFLKGWLAPGGKVYIEVPDASQYTDYDAPFLDFNSEHINHFGLKSLMNLAHMHGLISTASGVKSIKLPNGSGSSPLSKYPAMWELLAVGECSPEISKDWVSTRIEKYIKKSKDQLERINAYLERALAPYRDCAIWGANSYCGNIVTLPVFERVEILQVVDRNPALHGKRVKKVKVEAPSAIPKGIDYPIVVASLLALDSIKADAERMGLPNPVIGIRVGDFT